MPSTHAERSQQQHQIADRARASMPVAVAHENDVRRRYVLVRNDRDQAALAVLLRFDGFEAGATHQQLQEQGFQPSSSPVSAPVSWRRRIAGEDIGVVCTRLRTSLAGNAVLDLGATFVDAPQAILRRARDAWYWPGPFLITVGGTRRMVLFGLGTTDDDLDRALAEARESYWAEDFHSPTE